MQRPQDSNIVIGIHTKIDSTVYYIRHPCENLQIRIIDIRCEYYNRHPYEDRSECPIDIQYESLQIRISILEDH